MIERIFHAVYGLPLAQAACSASAPSRRRRWRGRLRTAAVAGMALSLSAHYRVFPTRAPLPRLGKLLNTRWNFEHRPLML